MARLGQFRRDTLANWQNNNPVLADGEFALIASDTTKPRKYDYWVCGDGLTPFNSLTMGKLAESIGISGITSEYGTSNSLAASQNLVSRIHDEKITGLHIEDYTKINKQLSFKDLSDSLFVNLANQPVTSAGEVIVPEENNKHYLILRTREYNIYYNSWKIYYFYFDISDDGYVEWKKTVRFEDAPMSVKKAFEDNIIEQVENVMEALPKDTEEDGFYICDKDGNVLIRLDVLDTKNGFGENLTNAIKKIVEQNSVSDLYDTEEDGFYICEQHGKTIAMYKDGKWDFLGLTLDDPKGMCQWTGDLNNGDEVIITRNSVKFNKKISFSCSIGTFDSIEVGQGDVRNYCGSWLVIDRENVTIKTAASGDNVETQVIPHGLTIENTLQVEIDQSDIFDGLNFITKIRLASNGIISSNLLAENKIKYDGSHGDVRVKSIGSVLRDCSLGWYARNLFDSIWVFGDSYVGFSTKRWTRYIVDNRHTNFLLNGFPGANSEDAYGDLVKLLEIGKPNKVVWLMGMNDPDTATSVNGNWLKYFNMAKDVCVLYGIEFIAATIPTVSGGTTDDSDVPAKLRVMKYKNAIVRSSGGKYVEFDKAVGANEVNGSWYSNMLSSDGVHPSETGAVTLYHRIVSDVPELLN